MTEQFIEKKTSEWYESYYNKCGTDRNDLLKNPEVLLQTLAYDASMISALRSIRLDPRVALVLDVGCGSGGSILNLLRLGFNPLNIFGLDILEERIREGLKIFPNINLKRGDASKMEFLDNTFDLVFSSTMFVQITDDDLSEKIAAEMLRVAKPHGYIILADWRYSKPGSLHYKALSKKRIFHLFCVSSRSEVCGVYRGTLVPPLGRFLSRKNMSFAYFGLQFIFPFLVGQMTTVLQKKQ